MKKIYTFLSIAILGYSSYGQQKQMPFTSGKIKPAKEVTGSPASSRMPLQAAMAPLDTITYETFGGGIPASWTQAGVDQIWEHSLDGSQGQYSSPGLFVLSTTNADGFMLFDADGAETNGANTYSKVYNGSLISNAYDFSAYTGINVRFQQFFRLCCSSATATVTFSVSNDGGTNWTDFDVKGAISLNSTPANPDVITLNVTALAAGQSSVMFKWTFSGQAYYWMFDDFLVYESPNNDMALNKVMVNQGYVGGGYYTQTPLKQIVPMNFHGIVQNAGNATQTNVVMNTSITDGASNVYTDATSMTVNGATLSSFASNAVDTLESTTDFTPASVVATYTATFDVEQTETEEIPANDTIVKVFAVSDSVYAHDNGVNTARVGAGQYVGGDASDAAIGSWYDVNVADTATSISAWISSTTDPGTYIVAKLFQYDTTLADFVEVANSDIYDITSAADAGKWVTLAFTGGDATLTAGQSYLAAIINNGIDATHEIYLGEDAETEQPDFTAWVYIPGDQWYWISRLPMIRLNTITPLTGINDVAENKLSVSQNQPNPFKGSTAIQYSLPKAAAVSLNVYDVTGKSLISVNEGQKSAGAHTLNLNASSLASGVYYYTLKAGETSVSKKLVIID